MKIPKGNFGDTLLVDGGWSPISIAIRRRTLSDWSHVARFVNIDWVDQLLIRYPDKFKYLVPGWRDDEGGVLVEALPKGVLVTPASKYKKGPWRVRRYLFPLAAHERATMAAFLMEQVGKPYDWKGVLLGHITRNPFVNNQKKWFCSELQAASEAEAGRKIIADTPASLVPPHLYASSGLLKTTDWHKRKPEGWPDGDQ